MLQVDEEMLRSYIKNVFQHDNIGINSHDPYKEWKNNKKHLYKLLGNNLIIEKDVEVKKDACLIRIEMDLSLIKYETKDKFLGILYDKIALNENSANSFYCRFDYFVNNSYDGKTLLYEDPIVKDKKPFKIHNGEKFMKIIKKFVDYYDLSADEYEQFRIEHSNVLGEEKIKGKLCLSIHPLDFFTMSDNENNWSSCMSWRKKGCYNVGTVEMMNSPYVIIAYLKSNSKEIKWDNYTWNSKRWRSLIVIDNNIMVMNKNYPYNSEDLSKECLFWIKELAKKNLGIDYEEEIQTINFYDGEENGRNAGEFNDINNGIVFDTNNMYNDLYSGHLCLRSLNYLKEPYNYCLNYSGEVTCVYCGQEGYVADDEVLCLECSKKKKCEHCEDFFFKDDLIDGLCPSCHKILKKRACSFCGKLSFDNSYIYCNWNESYFFSNETNCFICKKERRKYKKIFNEYGGIILYDEKIQKEIFKNFEYYRHFFKILIQKTEDDPRIKENPIYKEIIQKLNEKECE